MSLLSLHIPVIRHNAEIAAHFFDFGWDLNGLDFLNVVLWFSGPKSRSDILSNDQIFLDFDSRLQLFLVLL